MLNSDGKPKLPGLRYAEWGHLDSQLIWIYEGHPLGDHGTFNPWKLSAWLLTEGTLRVKGEGREVEATAGSWIFPPLSKDTRTFSKDASILSISFWLRWPDGRSLYDLPNALVLPESECPQLEKHARRLLRKVEQVFPGASVDLKSQKLDVATYYNLQRLFEGWISAYIEAMSLVGAPTVLYSQTDRRMLEAQAFLDREPLTRPFNMARVAKEVGMSLSHTDRLFRQEFDLSMKSYFEERRLKAALHYLTESSAPIKEIAFSVGFKNASSFSHWFAKKRGCYPREFREQMQVRR